MYFWQFITYEQLQVIINLWRDERLSFTSNGQYALFSKNCHGWALNLISHPWGHFVFPSYWALGSTCTREGSNCDHQKPVYLRAQWHKRLIFHWGHSPAKVAKSWVASWLLHSPLPDSFSAFLVLGVAMWLNLQLEGRQFFGGCLGELSSMKNGMHFFQELLSSKSC